MAGKIKLKGGKRYLMLHKFAAGVALLALLVVIVAGLQAGAYATTIAFRAFLVALVVKVLTRVVVSVLASSEEINSGKA